MKQITIGDKEILLVEVIGHMPLNTLKLNSERSKLQYGSNGHGMFYLELPPGSWRILGSGKASDITEDEWKKIHWPSFVGEGTVYKSFEKENEIFLTATESGHSLLSLHGFKPSETVILIKQ